MKRTALVILSLLAFTALSAQTFQGKVWSRKQDGTKEELPFAQIYYLEKEKLIDTDEKGEFTLNITSTATLVATYVGYTRDTVVVEPSMTSADFYISGENDLDQAVVVGRQAGTSISKLKSVKTEVITAAGICKMACCALAESFENSASVTVGYSDAITGAKQIKLLGLSGTYTQMLDENRPVMRGIASPFGLSFVPGQWLESIQIAKGPSSVINGLEAITGQINVEHRKPTDETPLFLQLYGSLDKMYEGNVASALQINDHWSVINMLHVGGTASKMDHNSDGFRDEPEDLNLAFTSRWLYYAPSGMQIRFGGNLIYDDRMGGQMLASKNYEENIKGRLWGSNIVNKGANGYVKVGVPITENNSSNIAFVADFNHHEFDAFFGRKKYVGVQNSVFANLIYQNEINDLHKVNFGLTFQHDNIGQTLTSPFRPAHGFDEILFGDESFDRVENSLALFGEYTLTLEDRLTFVGGLNLEKNSLHGWLFAPRANIKFSLTDNIVFRALGGRGYRSANIFTDNLGIFSSGRQFRIGELDLLEDAWTYGGNVTFYLPFGYEGTDTYLSFDYFRNDFNNQVIVDQESTVDATEFYNLDGNSFTNTYQVDFSVDPFERFNIVATFRYTDAKVTLKNQGLVERPLTSRFKGVLNMQYATAMNKWTFDFTAQVNGPMRLPNFAAKAWGMECSPVYPMLYAQVTRKFRSFDVYVGGENLTNFRQHDAIIGAADPFNSDFSANCIWGPLMGTKVYAGVRFTIWK